MALLLPIYYRLLSITLNFNKKKKKKRSRYELEDLI